MHSLALLRNVFLPVNYICGPVFAPGGWLEHKYLFVTFNLCNRVFRCYKSLIVHLRNVFLPVNYICGPVAQLVRAQDL